MNNSLLILNRLLSDISLLWQDRTLKAMQILMDSQTNYVDVFIENIQTINSLYNHPLQLMFDADNIYAASTQAM